MVLKNKQPQIINKDARAAIKIISRTEVSEKDKWAIDVAIKAIEQQFIHKKAFDINKETVQGNDIASFGSCPSCGYEVSSDMNHCLNCGQSLSFE